MKVSKNGHSAFLVIQFKYAAVKITKPTMWARNTVGEQIKFVWLEAMSLILGPY